MMRVEKLPNSHEPCLKDETTLADNKVSEDGFLVVMLSKSKTSGVAGTSSTTSFFDIRERSTAIGWCWTQLAMAFNKDGAILFLGDENGHLRVFRWPSMENIIDKPKAHSSVKDLDFSTSGSLLVSSGGGGPCSIWDLTSSTVVASLSKQNDEVFGLCRFSTSGEKNPVLYTTVKHGKGGSIVTWDTKSWKRIVSKHIVREPISALSVSPDGSLLAVGTAEGDVLVLNSTSMRVRTVVRKAHITVVTAMGFSETSRDLMSTSMDSSVRVTSITEKKSNGFSMWITFLIILLAIAVYILKTHGMIPEETWSRLSSHFRN